LVIALHSAHAPETQGFYEMWRSLSSRLSWGACARSCSVWPQDGDAVSFKRSICRWRSQRNRFIWFMGCFVEFGTLALFFVSKQALWRRYGMARICAKMRNGTYGNPPYRKCSQDHYQEGIHL